MKAKTISLPKDIKKQINKDIATIKTLLKDDKEFADETIEKILTLNVKKVHPDFIRDHMGKRYLSIKDTMTTESYNDFISLSNQVDDLADLIRLDHELTESMIDWKRLIQFNMSDKNSNKAEEPTAFSISEENIRNYKEELRNEISKEISYSYKLPFEEIQIIGNTEEGTNE